MEIKSSDHQQNPFEMQFPSIRLNFAHKNRKSINHLFKRVTRVTRVTGVTAQKTPENSAFYSDFDSDSDSDSDHNNFFNYLQI